MLFLLLRITVVVLNVLIGYWFFDFHGMLGGAVFGTILVSESERVIRTVQRSANLGGTGLRIMWRALCDLFRHSFVRRLAKSFAVAIFVGAATAIGHELGGKACAVIAAAAAVALGQSLVPSVRVAEVAEAHQVS